MGSTATYLLPYPELDDPADVPADVKELADRLELVLPTKEDVARFGQPNGYAPLGADGKVPASFLPDVAPPQTMTVKRKWTPTTVGSTTDFRNLLNDEIVFAAGELIPNGRVRIVLAGNYINSSGTNRAVTVTFALGAAGLWGSGSFTPANNANQRTWRFDAELLPYSPTVVRSNGLFVMGGTGAAGTGSGDVSTSCYIGPHLQTTTAVDLAQPWTLVFGCQHAYSHSGISMSLNHARVEIVGP